MRNVREWHAECEGHAEYERGMWNVREGHVECERGACGM